MPYRASIPLVTALFFMLVVLRQLVPIAQVVQLVDLAITDHEHKLGSVPPGERMTIPPSVVSLHSGAPVRPVPLKVTVVSLNASNYKLFDPFVYEVLLENLTAEPIAVPSFVDESLFRRDVPGTTSLTISLRFDDIALGQQGVGLQEAYGSPDINGSLISISPGNSVRFRGRGILALDVGRIRSTGWVTRDVAVRAVVDMWVIGQPPYRTVESTNVVDLLVRER